MLAVGITGGIGAGKSALADLLVAKGAELIDSDQIARDVVAPPSPVLDKLVERFGTEILDDQEGLDRAKMAEIAFSDPEALRSLNEIMHPVIGEVMTKKREAAEAADGICLYAIPLFTADHRSALKLDQVVVVDCPTELAIERLVAQRGFTEQDARARIEAQISRDERNALGDFVVMNDGDREALEREADALWGSLKRLSPSHG